MRPPPKALSPQQQRVLDFLVAEVAAGRPLSTRAFPSNGRIAKHMGWRHHKSAYDCLDAMANKGAIARKSTATGWRFELLDALSKQPST